MLWRWPKKSGFECDKDDEFPFQTNGQRTTNISDLGIFYLFFRCWKLHKKSTFRRLYYGKSGVVPGSGAGKAWVVRGPGDFCGGNFGDAKVGKLKWVCLPPKLTMANSFLLPCAQLTASVGMFLWQLGRIRPSKTNMTKWKSPTGKESMYLLLRIGDFQAIVMSVSEGHPCNLTNRYQNWWFASSESPFSNIPCVEVQAVLGFSRWFELPWN